MTTETDGAHTHWGALWAIWAMWLQHEANDVKDLIQILYNNTGLREEQVKEYRALRNKEAEAEAGDTLDEGDDDAAVSTSSGPAVAVAPQASSAFAALVSAVSPSPTQELEKG